MPGAQCTRSFACEIKSTRAQSPQVHRKNPAFPHAMVLTVYFVLSPAIGPVCHRRQRIWLVRPGRADFASADLTPASRRQDHTTLPSASQASVVNVSSIAHGKTRPAITSHAPSG